MHPEKQVFPFTVPDEEWGNYLIRVSDPTDGHATGTKVYIDMPYWSAKSRNTMVIGHDVEIFNR